MSNPHDSDWLIPPDYYGTILSEPYSPNLKKRVAECLSQFRALDNPNNPSIPYISAWREDDEVIWYEFIGSRLPKLLGCPADKTARVLSDSIIKRSIYVSRDEEENIRQKSIQQKNLASKRKALRRESKHKGSVEAIYKIALHRGEIIWLKDQAKIESFADDNICLSLGGLTCVTKEMKAAEQTAEAGDKLIKEREHLENLLEKQEKEIWKNQLEIVYRLAKATELRDNQASIHLTKMSHYCNILGKAAGLNDLQKTLLFHAAPMHDVGKIGISEHILQKPGPLTPKEFELMKNHSIIGAKLLSGNNSKLLKMAKTIALTHHEKWDGSGYPNSLHGKSIPLCGRIAAICDVFDALTSERPYKKAWLTDDAFEELDQGKGHHFDPELVDSFLQHIPEIMKIHDRFSPFPLRSRPETTS